MAKKPNYRADRIERERAKAAKKAKRLEAKTGKPGKPLLEEMPPEEMPPEEMLAVDEAPQDRVAEPSEGNAKGDADTS
jgi:hypothetical protein